MLILAISYIIFAVSVWYKIRDKLHHMSNLKQICGTEMKCGKDESSKNIGDMSSTMFEHINSHLRKILNEYNKYLSTQYKNPRYKEIIDDITRHRKHFFTFVIKKEKSSGLNFRKYKTCAYCNKSLYSTGTRFIEHKLSPYKFSPVIICFNTCLLKFLHDAHNLRQNTLFCVLTLRTGHRDNRSQMFKLPTPIFELILTYAFKSDIRFKNNEYYV